MPCNFCNSENARIIRYMEGDQDVLNAVCTDCQRKHLVTDPVSGAAILPVIHVEDEITLMQFSVLPTAL